MSRLPPGTQYVAVAAIGALALGVGAVATIDGNLWGIPLAVGGAVLLYWSVKVTRKG
jgi:membrane-bound ClpP family serine protease